MFLKGRTTATATRLTLALAVTSLCGCACRSYDIELLPQSDMNRRLSAVRVDVVWTTDEDADELRRCSSQQWFLGTEPLCRQRRFEGRVTTTEVSLQDIGGSPLQVNNGELVPPKGRDVNGFVIFALYAGMQELPKDALATYYDAAEGRTANARVKACKFRVRLQSAQITLEPEARKGMLESLR